MPQLNRYITPMMLFLLLVAVALISAPGSAVAVTTQPPDPTVVDARLAQLSHLRSLSLTDWRSRYDTLRVNVDYNWMDWSQDGCSSPEYMQGFYNEEFWDGCLRHDMMWRTLPVADAGTGRVWNQRNRLIADETFREDNFASCAILYPWDDSPISRTICDVVAYGYYEVIRSQYERSNTPEETSAELHLKFLRYPETGTVNCEPTVGRCLPVHYLQLDGRPLVPQNFPYLATNKPIAVDVIRGHLQAGDGPPVDDASLFNLRTDWLRTGELMLRLAYPYRGGYSSTVACPDSTTSNPYTVPVQSQSWPVTTSDATVKTTRLYIKACGTSHDGGPVWQLLPREVSYRFLGDGPEYQDGARVRHYEHLRAQSCTPWRVGWPTEETGSWLGTDCTTSHNEGYYADYYSFLVEDDRSNVQIYLKSVGSPHVDTYLYLIEGNYRTGSIIVENDDAEGTLDARITRELTRGTYTIVATHLGTERTIGSYRLSIENAPAAACAATSFVGVRMLGSWTDSDCAAAQRAGSYADYYTFTLTGSRTVQIDLTSNTDAYLYLISGTDSTADALYENDDQSNLTLNSRITKTLEAGTYTIAATTYDSSATGSYTLEVSGHR